MREHQVVINLKREQFEEVQRLARLAGSRSPSAYLRDRILNLLGMEQAEHGQKDAGSAKTSSDLSSVNQELSRMHRELQVFIAESLSSGSYLFAQEGEPGGFEEPYPPYVEVERQLERAQQILNSQATPSSTTAYGAQSHTPAQNPQSAGSAAAGMATGSSEGTLSAAGEQVSEATESLPPGGASQAGFSGYDSTAYSGTGSSGTIGSRMASFQNASQSAIRYSNLFSSGTFDTRQLSDSGVWMTPEIDEVGSNTSLGLPPGVGESEPVDQINDELEELADRAFAISPRLGTTEEPRARAELKVSDDDPLRELLDDTLVEHIQRSPEDQTADESASSVVYAAFPDEPVYGTPAQEPVLEEASQSPDASYRANEVWGSESLASQGFGESEATAAHAGSATGQAYSDSSDSAAAYAGSDTAAADSDAAYAATNTAAADSDAAYAGSNTAAADSDAAYAGSDTTADTSESDTTATGAQSSFTNDQTEDGSDYDSSTYQSAQIYSGDENEVPAPIRPPMDAPPPKRKKPAGDSDSEDSHGGSGGPPPKRRRKPH